MPHQPRPTKADIMALLSHRRGVVYGTMHQEMTIDQEWDYAASSSGASPAAKYITGFPADYPIKMAPIAKIGVDVGLNQIMVGETPTVEVVLLSIHRDDEKDQEDVDNLTAWIKGFLYQVDTYYTESPLRDFVRKPIALGLGCLSYAYVKDRWPIKPEQGKDTPEERESWERYERERLRAFPWDIRSVHPRNIFHDPDNEPPQDFIEVTKIRKRSMLLRYPHLAFGGDLNDNSEVERIIYCSNDWYAVYVADQPALTAEDGADDDGVAPNPFDLCWYKLAWSGLGDLDEQGRMEFRGKGLIRDARDVLKMHITLLNVLEVLRVTTALTPRQVIADEEAEAVEAAKTLVYGPMSVWPHSRRVTAPPMEAPPVPAVIFQELGETTRLLELIFGPEILRGEYRDDTASGQRQRLAQAKSIYRSIKQNCEQAVAAMIMDVLYIIKNVIQEPVTVWTQMGNKLTGLSLDPDRIPNAFLVKIDFSPPTAEEKAFRKQEGLQDLQSGAITMREFRKKYADVDDPDAMEDAKTEETIWAGPAIQNFITQKVLEALAQVFPPPALPSGASINPAGPVQAQNGQQVGKKPLAGSEPGPYPAVPTLGSPQDAARQMSPYLRQPAIR